VIFFYDISKNYDIRLMHTHFVKFDIPVVLSSKKTNTHVVWHVHNDLTIKNTKQKIKDIIKFRILSRNVEKIICVSEPVRNNLILRGSSAKKTIAIKNGVDIERIDLSLKQIDVKSVKYQFGFAEDDFIITMFGWDPYRKGVDLAIEAGKILEKENIQHFKILIVGREELRKFVGDSINYKWLKLADPVEEVSTFYKLSDVFLSASRSEGLPYSVGEAMVSGLPVISSNIPHVVQNFEKAGDGFVKSENGNANDLAIKIKELISLPESVRKDMGEKNRNFILKNLSVDEWSNQVIEVYKSVLERNA